MANWAISLEQTRVDHFSAEHHTLVSIDGFLADPETAVLAAILQNFASITPQYPGLRAPLDPVVIDPWLEELSPLLSRAFGTREGRWSMHGWFSVVTRRPEELLPIQRLPHVDGTDPDQFALMLYLHRTGHGGTAFFRHKSTGLEALSDETWPRYKAALEGEVAQVGLPRAAYVTDGEPLFERTHASEGRFNQAIFYRGNLLHSGVIDNAAPLPADPLTGRLTINCFLRPPA